MYMQFLHTDRFTGVGPTVTVALLSLFASLSIANYYVQTFDLLFWSDCRALYKSVGHVYQAQDVIHMECRHTDRNTHKHTQVTDYSTNTSSTAGVGNKISSCAYNLYLAVFETQGMLIYSCYCLHVLV